MKKFLVNDRIRAYRVKLILSNGDNQGEILKSAALDLARREGLDLVEVSNGEIPTCKIMDYGKLMYDQSKSERHQKHAPSIKEIKVKYMTDAHDLEIKKKKILDLLEGGHKVIFTMQLKGREKFLAGNAAKEKFNTIVQEFFSSFKTTQVQDGGSNLQVTVLPIKG